MSQPPPPPSLLASTHHLSTLLFPLTSPPPPPSSSFSTSSSIPPAALLHPLGPSSPADVARLRTRAEETLSHLRQSLSSFSSLALPSTSLPTDEGAKEVAEKKRDRDKFLTLLRDSSQHETTLLSLRETDASFAQSFLAARGDKYAGLYGALRPAEEETGEVLRVLERLGRELGLAGFRDDEGSEGRQERVTLSLGGKVMVVDFEVVRGGDGEEEKVEKVKVAYVPPGGADMLVSARAGEVLLSLLSPTPPPGEGAEEGEEQEWRREDKQASWRAVRRVLEPLKGLDEATERTGRDCFKLVGEDLVSAVEEVFPAANLDSSSSTPSPFPSLLPPYPSSSSSPTTASLLPRLLLYASPPAQLSSSFRSFLTGSSSSTSQVSPPEGVYTATLTLSALLPSPTAAAELGKEQGKEQETEYVALLDPPVPVTRETGRAICQTLGIEVSSETVSASGAGRGGAGNGVGLEKLLFGSAETAAEREWEVSFPTPSSSSTNPSSPAPHPLTITFRLAPHPYSSSSSAAPSFLATHLRFPSSSSPSSSTLTLKDRLLPALRLLEAQIRANELVIGVERRSKVEAEEKKRALEEEQEEGCEAGGSKGNKRVNKRGRGGKKDGEMSLDELFSDDPSSPPPPLPVYIHLSSPSPSPPTSSTADAAWPPPTITLTFPVPLSSSSAVPPEARGLPMALTISSLPSSSSSSSPPSAPSYRVHVQARPAVLDVLAPSPSSKDEEMDTGEADKEAGGRKGTGKVRRVKKLEEVLEVAGDLALAVRWVVKKLT